MHYISYTIYAILNSHIYYPCTILYTILTLHYKHTTLYMHYYILYSHYTLYTLQISVLAPNPMMGQTLGSALFSVMFLYSGFFIATDNIPKYW